MPRLKEFELTDADIVVMEKQAAEYLQHTGQRARRKYRRSLQAALADHELVERKPVISVQQPKQRQFDHDTEMWIKRTTVSERFMVAAIGGPIAAAGFLGTVMGVIWILQQIVRAAMR